MEKNKEYPYGKREDGSPKWEGFLGKLKMKDGSNRIATEQSIGINIDGKEILVPSIVPTLSNSELNVILKGTPMSEWPESIFEKSAAHAKKRISKGLSPFKEKEESDKENASKASKKLIGR